MIFFHAMEESGVFVLIHAIKQAVMTARRKSKQFRRKHRHAILRIMIPLHQQPSTRKGVVHRTADAVFIQQIFLKFSFEFSAVMDHS